MARPPVRPGRGFNVGPLPGDGTSTDEGPLPGNGQPAGVPTLAVNFRVTIGGREIAIARISPFSLAADPHQLKEERDTSAPGHAAWTAPPVPVRFVLSRALDGDRTLYAWRRAALERRSAMQTVVIRQLDREGRTVLNAWSALAWPIRWTGPAFDALEGGLAYEELEVVAGDLTWLREGEDGDIP